MVAEATRLIRSVHGNDQVPGIPYPIPTMREVDCARTLRKLLDLLTRLQEDKARLEGELKRGAEWAQVFGPGREESWKVDADREKARADKAEAERDTWQRLAIEHKARAERAEAERDALKADMAVAIGLLETPDRLRDMAKISVGGARNRMTAEADDIERLTAKYVDLHATLAGDRTDG